MLNFGRSVYKFVMIFVISCVPPLIIYNFLRFFWMVRLARLVSNAFLYTIVDEEPSGLL